MPLPINVREVLRGQVVESERLEIKAGWNPERVLHTLCAFANDFHNLGGGYVFIGVEERDGQAVLPPVGLEPGALDDIQKEILKLGYRIVPAYHPVVEPYVIDGRHVLALWAPGGSTRPYKAPVSLSKDNARYAYYIRKTSSTVEAKGDDERELLDLAARVPFDDRPNQRTTLADVQLGLIQAHLREIGSELLAESGRMDFAALCERMKITDGPPEHPWPRNVGLLFFSDAPEAFFPQVQIDVVQLPDGAGGDRIVERTFRGPLGRQLRDALGYLRNAVVQEEVRKYSDRAEADRFFNYPYAAIEEALVNAVYHRSYEEREPIEVRVLPAEITITSYPGPDRSIAIGDLERGSFVARRYRNRRIGEFLKELKPTEGRGTGVPQIIRVMRANGSPMPRFLTDDDRTYFATVLPVHEWSAARIRLGGQAGVGSGAESQPESWPASRLGSESALQPGSASKSNDGNVLQTDLDLDSGHERPHMWPHMWPHTQPQSGPQPGSGTVERRIMHALLDSALARAELLERISHRSPSGAFKQAISRLIAAGLIERTLPDRPNSRHQRYRLTRLGRTRAMSDGA